MKDVEPYKSELLPKLQDGVYFTREQFTTLINDFMAENDCSPDCENPPHIFRLMRQIWLDRLDKSNYGVRPLPRPVGPYTDIHGNQIDVSPKDSVQTLGDLFW